MLNGLYHLKKAGTYLILFIALHVVITGSLLYEFNYIIWPQEGVWIYRNYCIAYFVGVACTFPVVVWFAYRLFKDTRVHVELTRLCNIYNYNSGKSGHLWKVGVRCNALDNCYEIVAETFKWTRSDEPLQHVIVKIYNTKKFLNNPPQPETVQDLFHTVISGGEPLSV